MVDTGLSAEEKYQRIRGAMHTVLETLGLDLTDDSLRKPPSHCENVCEKKSSGLDYSAFPKIS